MKKSIRSFVLFGSFAVLVFCAAAAYAGEQYQTEISAIYGRSDASDDFRLISKGLSAEVFFAPVKTTGHPYAEAAFLERIGSVFLMALSDEVNSGSADGMIYEVGVNFARPGFPLAIQALYATSEFDYDIPGVSYDASVYAFSIGNYFMNNLLAGVEYTASKSEFSSPGFPTGTTETKAYGLFAKFVQDLAGGRALNFEGSLGQSKFEDDTETLTNTNIALSVDYFFNRKLSAGAGIEKSSGEDDFEEGMTYTANVRYFLTPRFSVRAGYERFLNGNAGLADERMFDLALTARF